MIDTGRRFYPVPFVKSIVDGLAMSRMNVLHFHLSEECFRVESKIFPELTGPNSCARSNGNNTAFYTQADITDLVAYSRLRGVRCVACTRISIFAIHHIFAIPLFLWPYTGGNDIPDVQQPVLTL
jgi:N-acetyl-beta-hexosaminidase|eukprot:COSAG02_NODE_21_length_53083_cov_95.733618_49_plen_125_part_00